MANVALDTDEKFLEEELNFGPHEPIHWWKKLQSCEEFVGAPRSKHTMVAFGDCMYFFGGDNGRKMLNDFLVCHIRDSSWARVVYTGTPPAPRYHHSAVVYKNSMFVFGGYTGDINSNSNLRNKNDLHEYKFTTSQWISWEDRVTGTLPPPRSGHGAVVYKDKMWIFAGYDGHARLNDMWALDFQASQPQWEEIEQGGDNPPTCCNFPMVVVDDSMYVFSGQSGAKITNNLYQYKFGERQWLRIRTEHLLRGSPSPPQRRYGHTMVCFGRSLYVFGGAADGILDNEIHVFDVDSRSWSVIQPALGSQVPCARVFHSAAVCNDAMYVFGGTVDPQTSRSGELFRIQFSSFPKCTLIDDFEKLLLKEQFCDVQFIVGSEELCVGAHAAVVAARSPYLRRKLLEIHNPARSGDASLPAFIVDEPLRVHLKEVSAKAFFMALYFMYTDHIHPELENNTREGMSVTQVMTMMDVHKLAILLETKRLELLSMQYIEASVNVDSVLQVLKCASELKLTSLKDYCMKFIIRESNFRKVIMSTAFESLDQPLMVQIIRRQQFRSRPNSPDPHAEEDAPVTVPTLQDDLDQFLHTDVGRPFTDVALKVGDDILLAHRPVLAARCAYFEALFRSFMPEDRQVQITFGKLVPTRAAFDSLLRYIYYGDVEIPPEDALYIFSAPNFYGFSNSQLHNHCKSILENSMTVGNVVRMLKEAHTISMQAVKDHCLSLIASNFKEVHQSAEFRCLKQEILLEIIDIIASRMK